MLGVRGRHPGRNNKNVLGPSKLLWICWLVNMLSETVELILTNAIAVWTAKDSVLSCSRHQQQKLVRDVVPWGTPTERERES